MIERCNYCGLTHETNETKVGGMVFKECAEYPNDNTSLGWPPKLTERRRAAMQEWMDSHNWYAYGNPDVGDKCVVTSALPTKLNKKCK